MGRMLLGRQLLGRMLLGQRIAALLRGDHHRMGAVVENPKGIGLRADAQHCEVAGFQLDVSVQRRTGLTAHSGEQRQGILRRILLLRGRARTANRKRQRDKSDAAADRTPQKYACRQTHALPLTPVPFLFGWSAIARTHDDREDVRAFQGGAYDQSCAKFGLASLVNTAALLAFDQLRDIARQDLLARLAECAQRFDKITHWFARAHLLRIVGREYDALR